MKQIKYKDCIIIKGKIFYTIYKGKTEMGKSTELVNAKAFIDNDFNPLYL